MSLYEFTCTYPDSNHNRMELTMKKVLMSLPLILAMCHPIPAQEDRTWYRPGVSSGDQEVYFTPVDRAPTFGEITFYNHPEAGAGYYKYELETEHGAIHLTRKVTMNSPYPCCPDTLTITGLPEGTDAWPLEVELDEGETTIIEVWVIHDNLM